MKDVAQMRESLRGRSCDVLYEDAMYMVGVDSKGEDSHHLLIDDIYVPLDRGIFQEFVRTDVSALADKLRRVNEVAFHEMIAREIPIEGLSLVLARAEIENQKRYINYLSSQNTPSSP